LEIWDLEYEKDPVLKAIHTNHYREVLETRINISELYVNQDTRCNLHHINRYRYSLTRRRRTLCRSSRWAVVSRLQCSRYFVNVLSIITLLIPVIWELHQGHYIIW